MSVKCHTAWLQPALPLHCVARVSTIKPQLIKLSFYTQVKPVLLDESIKYKCDNFWTFLCFVHNIYVFGYIGLRSRTNTIMLLVLLVLSLFLPAWMKISRLYSVSISIWFVVL